MVTTDEVKFKDDIEIGHGSSSDSSEDSDELNDEVAV